MGGTYNVIESGIGLTIQATYGQCLLSTSGPYCITGLYIQYFQESFFIQYTDNVNSNEINEFMSASLVNIIVSGDGTTYNITINDSPSGSFDALSTTIELVPFSNQVNTQDTNGNSIVKNVGYLNMIMSLSPIHYQQTQGHCNVYDFSPQVHDANNHLLYNGDVAYVVPFSSATQNVGVLDAWAASFAVLQSENGLSQLGSIENGQISLDSLTFSRFVTCPAASLSSVNKRSEIIIATKEVDLNLPRIPIEKRRVQKNQQAIQQAIAMCKQDMGLSNSLYFGYVLNLLNSCASDIGLTGIRDFTTGYSYSASSYYMKFKLKSITNPIQMLIF